MIILILILETKQPDIPLLLPLSLSISHMITYILMLALARRFFFQARNLAVMQTLRGKSFYLLAATLALAFYISPLNTFIRSVLMVLFTGNGHTYIRLAAYWLHTRYKRPHTLLRACVLRKRFDQTGVIAMCNGSIDDEMAWEHLGGKRSDYHADAADHILSPVAVNLECTIMAAVFEELDYRILPWLLGAQYIVSGNVFVLLSSLAFALMHNVNAYRNKEAAWSRWQHIAVFYYTLFMGSLNALEWVAHPAWQTALLLILWHFTDNLYTTCYAQLRTMILLKGLFPSETKLVKARAQYYHYARTRTSAHPYAQMRSFLLTQHVIPYMYHRPPPE